MVAAFSDPPDDQRVAIQYASESEAYVIGAIVNDGNLYPAISWLDPDWFEVSDRQIAWRAITQIAKRHGPLDLQAITDMMVRTSKGHIDAIAALLALNSWRSIVETLAHTVEHAKAICRLAQLRQKRLALSSAVQTLDLQALQMRLDEIDGWLPPEDHATPDGVITFSKVQTERIPWLWPGYIPLGKLSDCFGMPSFGKSLLFGADIAARVSRGSPMPDGAQGMPGDVLLIALEDGIGDTLKPRCELAGADLDHIHALQLIKDQRTKRQRMLTLDEDILIIEHAIRDHGVKLVVIDPIMAYLGKTTDSYKDQDVRRVLTPYAALAERTQCAIVIIRHPTKGGSAQAMYAGGGSTAFTGLVRLGMMVAEDPDDSNQRLLSVVKCNIAAKAPTLRYRVIPHPQDPTYPMVEWQGQSEYSAQELADRTKQAHRPISAGRQQIITLLETRRVPMTPREIAEALGLGSDELRMTLRRMVNDNQIIQSVRGLYMARGVQE